MWEIRQNNVSCQCVYFVICKKKSLVCVISSDLYLWIILWRTTTLISNIDKGWFDIETWTSTWMRRNNENVVKQIKYWYFFFHFLSYVNLSNESKCILVNKSNIIKISYRFIDIISQFLSKTKKKENSVGEWKNFINFTMKWPNPIWIVGIYWKKKVINRFFNKINDLMIYGVGSFAHV